MKVRNFIFIVTLASLSSCLKKEEYPPEPVITFNRLETYQGDSARLILDFTDGDGNFGLSDADTLAPNFCGDCPYHMNLHIDYFELQNGQWVEVIPALPFDVRVPFLEPTGQDKSQKGKINVLMLDYYLTSSYDTCKFAVQAFDRALNASNVVETSVFLKE
ncbi:MAG: hypothetical protein RL220_113 [Bacteroidota bacterium]